MTDMTDRFPLRVRAHARDLYIRGRARRAPEQSIRHIRHIEREYGQPLDQLIAGYFSDGESQASVARILGLSRKVVRRCSIAFGLEAPACPVTLQTRSRLHRARIRATMRKVRARRLRHNGAVRSVREWAEITGIPESTIRSRLALGWSVHRALTERPQS